MNHQDHPPTTGPVLKEAEYWQFSKFPVHEERIRPDQTRPDQTRPDQTEIIGILQDISFQ